MTKIVDIINGVLGFVVVRGFVLRRFLKIKQNTSPERAEDD